MLCMTSLLIDCAVSTKTDEVAPTPQTSACQNGQGTAGACTSCNEGYTKSNGTCQNNLVQNNLVLSVSSLTIYAQNGYSTNFTITTDQNWTITAPAWLSVSPTSGGPGSAIQVNLTTTTLNTTAGVTGILSVNATAKLDLSRTLNLTRTYYTNCGGTLGLSGPSIVIAKWVSVGAAVHSSFNSTDPNGRLLVAVAKGCGGGNTTLENNLRNAINITFNLYYSGSGLTNNFGSSSFISSPILSAVYNGFLSTDGVNVANYFFGINNDNSKNISLALFALGFGDTSARISSCNSKNQYLLANLANLNPLNNSFATNTCLDVTTSSFPPELKSTMNSLLSGAGKTDVIQ